MKASRGQDETVEPHVVVHQLTRVHGQPERHEDDDLRKACQRHVEAANLPFVRQVEVTENQPGYEDGEEAGTAGDRGEPVDHAGRGEGAQRVEAFAR